MPLFIESLLAVNALFGTFPMQMGLNVPQAPKSRCAAINDVMTLCQYIGFSGHASLTISYKGLLADSENVNVYVDLNGWNGVFSAHKLASANGNEFYLTLSDAPYNCQGEARALPRSCTQPSSEMVNLFRAAYGHGGTPAWAIELAFVNEKGLWDSDSGKNYAFTFMPKYND